jgi:hypothetical protein
MVLMDMDDITKNIVNPGEVKRLQFLPILSTVLAPAWRV